MGRFFGSSLDRIGKDSKGLPLTRNLAPPVATRQPKLVFFLPVVLQSLRFFYNRLPPAPPPPKKPPTTQHTTHPPHRPKQPQPGTKKLRCVGASRPPFFTIGKFFLFPAPGWQPEVGWLFARTL